MSLDLTTATDTELNSLVAEHVAGWTYHGYNPDIKNEATLCWTPPNREYDPMRSVSLPRYTTDANAVLELLEKTPWWFINSSEEKHIVGASFSEAKIGEAEHKSFPRAACLALLRAKGWDEPG